MEDRSMDPTSESSVKRQGEFFNLDINIHTIFREVSLYTITADLEIFIDGRF